MQKARFYEPLENGKLHCYLCPRHCHIGPGQTGFCFIRKNIDGKLYNLAYGKPCAVHIDPIEKKPLFHFLPGSQILSIGTAGCNLGCKFCQNWSISKARFDQQQAVDLTPEAAVNAALATGCESIAYTYNDPTIWAEYAMDIARLARENGLKNVMVTAGYITPEALPLVYQHIDAANVDLKAFTENFYRKYTLSHLEPVLNTLQALQRMGVWLEITNLVIPTLNDAEEEIREMCRWILDHLGNGVPLHFTAFHPDFKLTHLPRTPRETLERARQIALDCGLQYVYTGNVFSEGNHTYCPNCHRLVIRRSWHDVLACDLNDQHCCIYCGYRIPLYTGKKGVQTRPAAWRFWKV